MTTTKIRLALADDHPAVLSGIKAELAAVPMFHVIGTARNSTEIVELLSRERCDILITDYAMPGGEYGDGMALLSFLKRRYPDLKIIVFTTIDNKAMLFEMLKLGIQSVLSKVDDVAHLISAIQAVSAGGSYFSPHHMQMQSVPAADISALNRQLTRREAEVIRLYVSGMSINAIAEQLHRTKQTVSAQKVSGMRKLGIERDSDLFRFAYETGLVVASTEPPRSEP